jgi:hypothetical protein
MSYDYMEAETLDTSEGESWNESWNESIYDSYDNFDADSWAENSRRRRAPRPVPTAKGGSMFRPRPNAGATGPVTQAQLEAALARVRQEVRANATGIKTLDGRVRTVAADQSRFETATKKQVDKLRSDLKTTQTLSALIPLIAKPGTAFGNVAPLLHLVASDLTGTGNTTASSTPGNGLLGNSNNLVAIGALAYASGVFDKPSTPPSV